MSGEEQTVTDPNGNVVHFSVSPDNNLIARVSNGSHKVNAWGIGWNVTFYVKTSGNNITSAYDLSYMIAMPVNSASVKRDNNKQATARFSFSTPVWNVLSWTGMVRAKIVGSNLVVYND